MYVLKGHPLYGLDIYVLVFHCLVRSGWCAVVVRIKDHSGFVKKLKVFNVNLFAPK